MVFKVLVLFGTILWIFLGWVGKVQVMAVLNSLPQVCILKIFTGLKCAFCGMTHSLVHVLFFDFGEAISENALSLPLFLLASVAVMMKLGFAPGWKVNWTRLTPGALIVLCTYAVFRNLS